MKIIKLLLVPLISLTFFACSNEKNSTKSKPPLPQNETPDPKMDSPTNPLPDKTLPTTEEPQFEYLAHIREFGDTDTAALFGIKPSKGELQIIKVTGPKFLGGYKWGQLTPNTINYFFTKSSIPLSQKENEDFLSKYGGAQVIYFENYNGELCTDEEFKVSLFTTIDELKYKFSFIFRAIPKQNSGCEFHVFGMLKENHHLSL